MLTIYIFEKSLLKNEQNNLINEQNDGNNHDRFN